MHTKLYSRKRQNFHYNQFWLGWPYLSRTVQMNTESPLQKKMCFFMFDIFPISVHYFKICFNCLFYRILWATICMTSLKIIITYTRLTDRNQECRTFLTTECNTPDDFMRLFQIIMRNTFWLFDLLILPRNRIVFLNKKNHPNKWIQIVTHWTPEDGYRPRGCPKKRWHDDPRRRFDRDAWKNFAQEWDAVSFKIIFLLVNLLTWLASCLACFWYCPRPVRWESTRWLSPLACNFLFLQSLILYWDRWKCIWTDSWVLQHIGWIILSLSVYWKSEI